MIIQCTVNCSKREFFIISHTQFVYFTHMGINLSIAKLQHCKIYIYFKMKRKYMLNNYTRLNYNVTKHSYMLSRFLIHNITYFKGSAKQLNSPFLWTCSTVLNTSLNNIVSQLFFNRHQDHTKLGTKYNELREIIELRRGGSTIIS